MIRFETYDDDESKERTIELPTKNEVCPTCDGSGVTVNPSIDGNGLSAEDFAEAGEEFRSDYFRGVYDITCPECKGRNVIEVPDEARCDAADLQAYYDMLAEKRAYSREQEAERRMGA